MLFAFDRSWKTDTLRREPCHLVDEECDLRRTRSRAPPRPAAKGAGETERISWIFVSATWWRTSPIIRSWSRTFFWAARRRTPIWCPKYEIFDLAFSPETEHGPECREEVGRKSLELHREEARRLQSSRYMRYAKCHYGWYAAPFASPSTQSVMSAVAPLERGA
jgi:hypothetical protein